MFIMLVNIIIGVQFVKRKALTSHRERRLLRADAPSRVARREESASHRVFAGDARAGLMRTWDGAGGFGATRGWQVGSGRSRLFRSESACVARNAINASGVLCDLTRY